MQTSTEQFYASIFKAGGQVLRLPQDLRDYVFGSQAPDHKYCPFQWNVSKFASKLNLLGVDSARQDQASWNSCTGNAGAKLFEIQLNERVEPNEISRRFLYFNALKRYLALFGKTVLTDSGTSVPLIMAEATNRGLALESLCPYENLLVPPSAEAVADGLTRLLSVYERVGVDTQNILTGETNHRDLVADVKVAINCGMPVIFGTGLTSAFYSVKGPMATHRIQYNPLTFVDPMTPGYIGGHCMVIVGYDDDLQSFIVENSWGSDWGDNGLIAITYASLRATGFDFFVARGFDDKVFEIPDELYIWDTKQREVSWDFDGIAGQTYRLYQAAFNRRPDWDGQGYWMWVREQGRSLEQVAEMFATSAEFIKTFGRLSNRDFVRMMYLCALYREPDAGGWAWHTDLLDKGLLNRGQTMIQFSESPENKQNCLSFLTEGIKYFPYKPAV